MKTLMLNPPYVDDFCRSARWAAKSRGRVQRHPDWMLIAAAVLEKANHNVRFLDGAALNLKTEDVKNQLEEFKPELVVLHTTTPSIYNDISYAQMSKQLCNPITVLVGPHVSAVPENTFEIADGSVDIVTRGEYDYTLKDIADGKPLEDVVIRLVAETVCELEEALDRCSSTPDQRPLVADEPHPLDGSERRR